MINIWELVEIFNCNCVFKEPAPATADTRSNLDATQEDLKKKNRNGQEWIFEATPAHKFTDEGSVRLKVVRVGDFAPTLELP